jgi:hypothetical protein
VAGRDRAQHVKTQGENHEMSHDEDLARAERIFGILAGPYSDSQKLEVCMAFLRYAPFEFYADCPRECKAIVSGAFEHGASWQEVADAASMDIAEAQRRWIDVETPRAAHWLGNLLEKQGKRADAKMAFQRAIDAPEAYWPAAIKLATMLAFDGDVAGGRALLRRTIDHGDKDSAKAAQSVLDIMKYM